jgi:S-formylglutathione hydrolase FrmB
MGPRRRRVSCARPPAGSSMGRGGGGGGWFWCDPRPAACSRYVTAGFLISAVALAGVSFAAGRAASSPRLSMPVSVPATAAMAVAPLCSSSTSPGPFVVQPAGGHVDGFSVDGRQVLAYLPAATAASPEGRLPVVYFLHGSPGAAPDWTGSGARLPELLDRMQVLGQLPPLIAVFPDGNTAHGTWWGNTVDGADLESWFVDGLVPAVDHRYRTLGAAQRGIAGVSAGGFGALNLALRHPGVFAWVASYSAVFTAPAGLFGHAAAANSPALTVAGVPATRRFPLFVGAGAADSEFRGESESLVDPPRSGLVAAPGGDRPRSARLGGLGGGGARQPGLDGAAVEHRPGDDAGAVAHRGARQLPLRRAGGEVPTWRRGGDSNPRWALTHTAFRERHLKPLGHLSAGHLTYSEGPWRTVPRSS